MDNNKNTRILDNNLHAGYRIFKKNGKFNSKQIGLNRFATYNIYHLLINISWTYLIFIFILYCLFVGILFSTIYYLIDGHSLMTLNLDYKILIEKFFLTFQNLTSGFSKVDNNYVNIVSLIVALIGVLTFAIITGVLYGRFAKPNAKFFYSKNIIVSISGKKLIYNFRVANAKLSQLVESEAKLIIALDEFVNYQKERKYYYVNLMNNSIAFLNTSWTISHFVDRESPLYNLNLEDLVNKNAEFILLIKAVDDTYATQVYTTISYQASDVIWGANFESISNFKNNKLITDVRKINKFSKNLN